MLGLSALRGQFQRRLVLRLRSSPPLPELSPAEHQFRQDGVYRRTRPRGVFQLRLALRSRRSPSQPEQLPLVLRRHRMTLVELS